MLVGGALVVALASSSAAPVGEAAPQPTIEFSSQTDGGGRTTVKIVLEGVPPENLTPERLNALMGFLGNEIEGDHKAGTARVRDQKRGKRGEAGLMAAGDRELREFDMELNLHWKRAASPGEGPARDRRNRPGGRRAEEAAKSEESAGEPVDRKIGVMADGAKTLLKNLQGGPKDATEMKRLLDPSAKKPSEPPKSDTAKPERTKKD